mgnify:CR=1 FL=1
MWDPAFKGRILHLIVRFTFNGEATSDLQMAGMVEPFLQINDASLFAMPMMMFFIFEFAKLYLLKLKLCHFKILKNIFEVVENLKIFENRKFGF